jgi:hypothetical protein
VTASRHPHGVRPNRCSHVHRQKDRGDRRGAGVAVGRHAIGTPPGAKRLRPAASAFRAACKRRPAAAPRRCRPAMAATSVVLAVFKVIDGQCAEAAARDVPPERLSCSACSLTGRPSSRATSKTRADLVGGEGDGPSQKASTASTRLSAWACREGRRWITSRM